MWQSKKIIYEGDGCRVEDGGDLFLIGTLVNKAIYMDLMGRNEIMPLGGSIKDIGIEEVVFLYGISNEVTINQ